MSLIIGVNKGTIKRKHRLLNMIMINNKNRKMISAENDNGDDIINNCVFSSKNINISHI